MNSGLIASLSSAPLRTPAVRRRGNDIILPFPGSRGGLIVAHASGHTQDMSGTVANYTGLRATRGIRSVDLQATTRIGAASAGGNYATIFGGYYSTANGTVSSIIGARQGSASNSSSVALGGRLNSISGQTGMCLGGYNNGVSGSEANGLGGFDMSVSGTNSVGMSRRTATKRMSCRAHAHGDFGVRGDAQVTQAVMKRTTTTLTATAITLNGSAPSGATMSTSNRWIAEASTCAFVDAFIVYRNASGQCGAFHRRCVVKRSGASVTATVAAYQTVGTDYDEVGGCVVGITADDTNDAVQIDITAGSTTATRWMAEVRIREVTL